MYRFHVVMEIEIENINTIILHATTMIKFLNNMPYVAIIVTGCRKDLIKNSIEKYFECEMLHNSSMHCMHR